MPRFITTNKQGNRGHRLVTEKATILPADFAPGAQLIDLLLQHGAHVDTANAQVPKREIIHKTGNT